MGDQTCLRVRFYFCGDGITDVVSAQGKFAKAKHDTQERQAAMQALLPVAEHDGPTMFARIIMLRALNRHVARAFEHW